MGPRDRGPISRYDPGAAFHGHGAFEETAAWQSNARAVGV
jgi:hypothetical protein